MRQLKPKAIQVTIYKVDLFYCIVAFLSKTNGKMYSNFYRIIITNENGLLMAYFFFSIAGIFPDTFPPHEDYLLELSIKEEACLFL